MLILSQYPIVTISDCHSIQLSQHPIVTVHVLILFSMTTAQPVTMSEALEGKLISLAADILIDNLVQDDEKGNMIKVRK